MIDLKKVKNKIKHLFLIVKKKDNKKITKIFMINMTSLNSLNI